MDEHQVNSVNIFSHSIAQLKFRMTIGKNKNIRTDEDWRLAPAPPAAPAPRSGWPPAGWPLA